MANQPKTPLVAFRYERKDALVALAESRGVTLTVLMREAADALLGVDVSGEET